MSNLNRARFAEESPQLHAINFGYRWFVDCLKCLGRGTKTYLRDDAIAAWNHRPIEDALVTALRKVLKLDGYQFVDDALKAAGKL